MKQVQVYPPTPVIVLAVILGTLAVLAIGWVVYSEIRAWLRRRPAARQRQAHYKLHGVISDAQQRVIKTAREQGHGPSWREW